MIRYMVFAGGGTRGLAYVGFLRYFWWLVQNCVGFAGTSIGALIALTCVIGITYDQLAVISDKFADGQWFVPNAFDLPKIWGLDSGHGLQQFIEGLLEFGGFSRKITFAELFAKTSKKLVVVAACPETSEAVIFDDRSTVSVALAVRASMSLMPFFAPVKIQDRLLCDGGIVYNFPLHVFPPTETFGIGLRQTKMRTVGSFQEFMSGVISLVGLALEDHYINSIDPLYNFELISVPTTPTVSLPLLRSTRSVLVAAGDAQGKRVASILAVGVLGFFFSRVVG